MRLTQGEIADRISILEIKRRHGGGVEELAELMSHWKGKQNLLDELRFINGMAWDRVERIHAHFGGKAIEDKDAVIDDCKWAHFFNKMRVGIKNRINADSGEYQEFKTWKSSTT